MLLVSRLLQSSKHRKIPDVAKLLYGKRKNAFHRTSAARPASSLVLSTVPNERLASAVERAVVMKELSNDDVLSLFRSNRALRRLDRSHIIVQALRHAGFSFTPYHYSLLMAHANEQGQTQRALEYWDAAVREGKVNAKLHGALLATYRCEGKWKTAVAHCYTMWEDKLSLDAHALHAAMNACRRYGPWHMGLSLFSQAIIHGTKPNNVVYLELLRVLENAKPLRNRWRYALTVLRALDGKVDVTAGHYNAVLATLRGTSSWEKGVALFMEMKEKNVQPSPHTLSALLQLNSSSVAHCIRCIAEAHTIGMPIRDTMYRAVLSNLFSLNLDHEAVQFMESEYQRDRVDVGSAFSATLSMSMALLDALLAHPRPRAAIVLYESFESQLGSAIGAATRDLGMVGLLSQRWLVQGRVAVVDHNILLSPRMESLISHYDSILIPFSSVRLLVRRSGERVGTKQNSYTHRTLHRLRLLLKHPEWPMVRVLPFVHQLLAHQYLVEGPTSHDALHHLREEARTKERASLSFGQKLLSSLSTSHAGHGALGEEGGSAGGAAVPLLIRLADESTAGLSASSDMAIPGMPHQGPGDRNALTPHRDMSALEPPNFLKGPDRITSTERMVAVAVMLKSLNPEADIHVLSTNRTQLDVVERWNALRLHTNLTAVEYPQELFLKAPPQDPNSDGKRGKGGVKE